MAIAYWGGCGIGKLCAAHDADNTHTNNCAYSIAHGTPYGNRDACTYIHNDAHIGAPYNHQHTHGDSKCNLHGNP